MSPTRCRRWYALIVLGWIVATPVAAVHAAEADAKPRKYGQFNPADESVELFEAIKAKKIDVRVIPKDSSQIRVLINNKTPQPLNVKLPDAFAAVQVLAQLAGGGASRGGMGGGMMNQSMGGGMGGMGMGGMGGGMGGMGGGGGMFNIPPGKQIDFKVATVCLEHGKGEPRSTMTYELRPMESVTDKPGVYELCKTLGLGQLNQHAAQAAAWNLNNGMSWSTLAAKRIERTDGDSYPYFTSQEIQAAMAVAQVSVAAADESTKRRPEEKPATTTGASQSAASRQSNAADK